MSTFKVVGTSKLNGVTKVRFANDMTRVKVLQKNDHTEIDLVELVEPLSKADAVAYLIKIDFANGRADVAQALAEASDKRIEGANKETRKTKEAKKPKKAPAPKAITIEGIRAKAQPIEIPQVAADEKSKAEIQAELDAMDDAPY